MQRYHWGKQSLATWKVGNDVITVFYHITPGLLSFRCWREEKPAMAHQVQVFVGSSCNTSTCCCLVITKPPTGQAVTCLGLTQSGKSDAGSHMNPAPEVWGSLCQDKNTGETCCRNISPLDTNITGA